MADISRITLPGGSAYDIKDSIRGVEYIVGTQTEATGSWTGVTNRASLFDGMMIKYYLPFAGSGNASLNLTLSGGSTTGDKPVYFNDKTRVKTHFPANSVLDLVYSTKIESTGAWVHDAQYYTNSVTQTETTTNNDYEVLFSVNKSATSGFTGAARKNTNFKYNPNTQKLMVNNIEADTLNGSRPWKVLQDTLTAGETEISFTNSAITAFCRFDVYTSVFGINVMSMFQSSNTVTLTFKEMDNDLSIQLVIWPMY